MASVYCYECGTLVDLDHIAPEHIKNAVRMPLEDFDKVMIDQDKRKVKK